MRDIHISIVSHGHARHLTVLFACLAEMSSSYRYQVTLIKNVAEVDLELPQQQSFPVRIIDNASPQGFARNHNMAFAEPPLADQCAYFVVLNPDTQPCGDLFADLAGQLDRLRLPGVIAPAVFSPNGEREDSARELPTIGRLLRKLFGRSGSWTAPSDNGLLTPDWVAGMCMMFPHPVFLEIGGFDESYHLYYEDVDICSRLWLAGYSVWVDPAQSIVHAAQRYSRRHWRYARWHLASIARFFASDVYRKARALHRQRIH